MHNTSIGNNKNSGSIQGGTSGKVKSTIETKITIVGQQLQKLFCIVVRRVSVWRFSQQSHSIVARTNFEFHAVLDNNEHNLFAPP
jgi:hypothetical protein